MFQSQNLGFARRHFEGLSEGDISKQYAKGKAVYVPPTGFLARLASGYTIESKITDLGKFYPHDKLINQTVQDFKE